MFYLKKKNLINIFFCAQFYKDKSFYSLRTDALDRFSTKLEKRFTKDQIKKMLNNANLEKIQFRNGDPYWCVIGYKKG